MSLPAAALSLAALLVSSQVNADTVKEIRIAVPDISAGTTPSGAGIVDVLREQQSLEKEFEKDGIKIRWDFFKGAGPAINEALANGQEDFAYLGDFPAIIGKAGGLDTRLLSAVARDVKLYLAVQPGSGITTLEALKGKRVAIFRGTATQLSFASALAHQGLKESDYKVVNLDYNAANAALAAKQIDGTWAGAGVFALKARGLADVPLNTADLDGAGSMQAVLLGRGAFVDQHPELVARLIKAQQPAIAWLRNDEHKQDYINLVARLASFPAQILTADAEGQSLVKIFAPQLDAPFLDNLQRSVDLALDAKLIRKGFEVKSWAEPRFLDDALQAESKQASNALQSPQASR
ncbi:nitrate ABC transporter substrate-binding protein [Pseudomonas sp. PB120]|uniref:ABC transporter substrate-binding protein n=1 Tax=Pseudomonas sp. PB120 TaxID=2494700 RepID=UPI0012FD51DB|nr:ABC transporter substrate-binding protein [Pseudomonas sp. PB120]MVV48108.1 nitrate ABC transporter substrate-binding protein [Pseudomonas sp. PB120]